MSTAHAQQLMNLFPCIAPATRFGPSWVVVFCLLLVLAGSSRAAEPGPNVLLVITDDQGYGDLGVHGNDMIETPNLDALARESVRLTNFHVDPTCAETRAALMTGRYACRTGVWHTIMGRSLLRPDEITLAELFSASGYRTGIFGKWHLGDNYPLRPQDRGFQTSLVHGGGGIGQTPDAWGNDYFDDTYLRDGMPQPQQGYCTDVFFQAAMQFIERSQDEPFFCYLATNAPHSPYRVPAAYRQRYEARGVSDPIASFYGMISNIDENLGRLLRRLDELGKRDNTLVIFMTDNGSAIGGPPGKSSEPNASWRGFNAGMRGAKGSQYEGGHRVPCFLRWPAGHIGEPRAIGRLTAHFDLLPTLVEFCRLARSDLPLDGRSLAPLLRSQMAARWPERTLVVHSQRVDQPEKWRRCAVMTERWRLVDGRELYDVQRDSGQRHDLAGELPDVVATLRHEYEQWWDEVSQRFSEDVGIVIGADEANPTHLTAHDWHGDVVPWNHELIKKDPSANGTWALEIARSGRYRFTLSSRPAGVPAALSAGVARVEVAEQTAEAAIRQGASGVDVELDLAAGRARLRTVLEEDNRPARGAYYVTVERLQ